MPSDLFAAIDLGANSFHLSIVENSPEGLRTVTTNREIIHFNRGINDFGAIHPVIQARALKCLDRFHILLQKQMPRFIRAVGTSSFRQLGVSHAFIPIAEAHLGCTIEVLTGEEEAKLIYQGATWGLPNAERMVIDIGGGSTELALGFGPTPHFVVSLPIGSAQLSEQCFAHDVIHPNDITQAKALVHHELSQITWPSNNWSQVREALGTSGTVKAISDVLANLKLSHHSIELNKLERLEPILWQVNNRTQLSQILNLNNPRTRVFPGGFIILLELFKWFDIPTLKMAQRALREGIVVNFMQSS